MAKINFTKEHEARLDVLAVKALKENKVYKFPLGQLYSVLDLMHTVSINSLNNYRASLSKAIQQKEEKDEWIETNPEELTQLKEDKELVNLIIGWKRKAAEIEASQAKKAALIQKLAELKESTKTPEERIKELEAEIAALEDF